MTLSYCSLSCWSSASLVNERCSTTEKVPRIPQTTATVTEIVRISRTEIDRSLNMGTPKLRQKGEFGTSQIMFNNLRLTRWSAVLPCSRPLERDQQQWEVVLAGRAPFIRLLVIRSPSRSCPRVIYWALFADVPGSAVRIILPTSS